jgi:RHS repeat-associated protein
MACDYDSRGRLTLLCTTSERWIYTYDAFDRRVGERHVTGWSDDSCKYLYDGEVEIGRATPKLSELRLMMAPKRGMRPRTVALELAGELFFTSTSYRGDVTSLFDKEGNSVETVRYSAFGDRKSSDLQRLPWGFAGKRVDASGLLYFGRRYYLPSWGRWLSPDPAGYIDGSNLHRFCLNNPLSFIDWLGEASEGSISADF